MDLTGKVVLVTGGTGGIGAEVARSFFADGASVVVTDVEEGLPDGLEEGPRVTSVACDVRRGAAVDLAVATAVERFGGLDVAVATAGIVDVTAVDEMLDEAWDRMIAINLTGTFHVVRAAARAMVPRGGGSIVTTTSINSFWAGAGNAHYCAAKAGVAGLVRGAAVDLGPKGIRVNCVAPGLIDTPIGAPLIADPEMSERWLRGMPLARFGTPADVAGAVRWLASDASAYVTGQEIVVDGGKTVGAQFVDAATFTAPH